MHSRRPGLAGCYQSGLKAFDEVAVHGMSEQVSVIEGEVSLSISKASNPRFEWY